MKYQTQYKDSLRAKYEYSKWFEEKFRVQIYIEEIADGFLHYYKRKIDFLNANLDFLILEDLQQLIKNQNLKISQELINQVFTELQQKK